VQPERIIGALALLCAFLAGALARDLLVPFAAAAGDMIVRADVLVIVRALEQQAHATKDIAREVRDAGRNCK
jgi:hypothetical protein